MWFLQNDLGIKATDKEAMKANLIAQGITDIASIDTSGSTEVESTAGGAAAAPAAPLAAAGAVVKVR